MKKNHQWVFSHSISIREKLPVIEGVSMAANKFIHAKAGRLSKAKPGGCAANEGCKQNKNRFWAAHFF
jgi:hypothetical protein